jgi:lipopolysaccharide/colanic/teichoic acid biosynthesis glycosyltransferase
VKQVGKIRELASADSECELSAAQRFSSASLLLKRLFDICIASGLLVVLSPVLAVTALLIFATLGRPLVFRQERCGKGQRIFIIGKFRTLSDARDSHGTLLPDERRQTAITAFLRRIRVDELPQLIAVLRGDMSFIGPRPLPYERVASYGAAGKLRCSVAPGMTGWAQVNGNTLLTMDDKIALDIFYIDRRSLWMDIRIVFMTLRTIIVGEAVSSGSVESARAHMKQIISMLGRA